MCVVLTILLLATIAPRDQVKASSVRDDIVSIAKGQLGTPYRFGGTTPSGFDCSGFIRYVFNGVGIDLPRTSASQYRAGTSVSKSDLEVGDLVFFNTTGANPSHSGIYIGSNQFIHASSSNGISISNINDPHYWGSRYIGARRVLEEIEVQQVSLKELPAGQYHDVSSDFWAVNSIRRLGEQTIITGYEGSLFKPNEQITRAQVAIILTRALNLEANGESVDFHDVSSSFHAYDAIQAVAQAGFFSGDSKGNFRPNDPFTREHIALVFKKAFELPDATAQTDFKDVSDSRHSYQAIQSLAESGITSGYKDGTFRPGETTTRAQLSVFFDRALSN
ncbi:cell wall lytic activity [Halalkalibacter wakoensis JCM 9140]|uniref:Cell wall lytic activity n=2 Tax=Halalkalibacter wakoensis TaxID=127891 RepID=W4Q2E3_9BACI|nr:cell wall lytic activity [Halalkalibacter wakoensis JCM 9140]